MTATDECRMNIIHPPIEPYKPVTVLLKCGKCGGETVAEGIERFFDYCPYCGRRVVDRGNPSRS